MGRRDSVVVDLDGLAQLMQKRTKSFILFELYQNSRDCTGVTEIDVSCLRIGHLQYKVTVTDDCPTGFTDLSHAWTLFAPSEKKDRPESGGLFNMGEKLIIAVAKEVVISTMSGGVRFDSHGRSSLRGKTKVGSNVEVTINMTNDEYEQACREFKMVIPTNGIHLTFNGDVIEPRTPESVVDARLPCPLADSIHDKMQTRLRETKVSIYRPRDGEDATLYELGIPVVTHGGDYHYVVHQKVPVPMDRDNVPPAFVAKMHTVAYNAVHRLCQDTDLAKTWVQDAMESPDVTVDAITTYSDVKYGVNSVGFDLNDREANSRAFADGRKVVYGGNESGKVWGSLRRVDRLLPSAGLVFPTQSPYSLGGKSAQLLEVGKITPGMRQCEAFWQAMAEKLMGVRLDVLFVDTAPAADACYLRHGPKNAEVHFFVKNIHRTFFDRGVHQNMLDLMLDEFGHQYETNHLDQRYYLALRTLGAKMTMLAIEEPEFYLPFLKPAERTHPATKSQETLVSL